MAEQLTSAVAVLHQQAVCAEVVPATLEYLEAAEVASLEAVCVAAEYSLAAECEAAEEVASLAVEEDAGRRYSSEFRV